MSEKEKQFAEMVSRFPPDLKEKFLNQATGAAMALDALGVPRPEKREEEKHEPCCTIPRC